MPRNTLESFTRLRAEIRRLKRVHDVTLYAYQQTRDYTQKKLQDKEIFPYTKIDVVQESGDKHILARSPHEMMSRLSDTYPGILRKALFVTAVSQFEVFIVDTVWEISKYTLEPFKQQDKIVEYPNAQILSYGSIEQIRKDIIGGECRQLTSQGFNYARKYYEQRFDIRFSDCPVPVAELEEIHERRHLLVHRGGRIDKKYQRRFAPNIQVDEQMTITEEYFHHSLDKLVALGQVISDSIRKKGFVLRRSNVKEISIDIVTLVDKTLSKVWERQSKLQVPTAGKDEMVAYWFKATFKDSLEIEQHLGPAYTFSAEGENYLLSEILLASVTLSDCEAEWIVYGPRSIVGMYIAFQKFLSRRGHFAAFDSKKLVRKKSGPGNAT